MTTLAQEDHRQYAGGVPTQHYKGDVDSDAEINALTDNTDVYEAD